MDDTLTPEGALIYLMVVMSASDRRMSDRELRTIGAIVKILPIFANFDVDKLVPTAQACATLLAATDGLGAVLDRVRKALPAELRETAYAVAVEVAAADGRLGAEERRLLDLVGQSLAVDARAATAIERSAHVRYLRHP